jgi:O-antigen/teichoic acid export membrane protein
MGPSENRSRRVTRNTLFLYSAEAASRLLSYVLLAFLWRHWGDVATYGEYALAVNWVSILAVFSELGLNTLVVREVARRREMAPYYLRNVIALRSVFSILAWGGLISAAFVLGYEPVLKMGMAIMGLRIILDSVAGGYLYLFQSHEMMGYFSLINVLGAAIRLVGIVIVVETGGGVVEACSIWTASSAAALVVLALKSRKMGWKPDFSLFRWSEAFAILSLSIPLATFGALQTLYYRVDSVILKSLSGNEAVGYYDMASKLLFVILAFSQIFATAIFPVLSSVRDEPDNFGRMSGRALKFLLGLAIPLMVGGWLMAKPVILLLANLKYAPSIPMFAVLMLSAVPYFLSHIYVIALVVYNSIRLNIQFAVLFILNAALNFALIPRMGAVGSAWATVFCEFLALGFGFWLARPYLRELPWKELFRPAFAFVGAGALMGTGIFLDPRLYWLGLGPVVYVLGVWVFGGIGPDEKQMLKSLLKIKGA